MYICKITVRIPFKLFEQHQVVIIHEISREDSVDFVIRVIIGIKEEWKRYKRGIADIHLVYGIVDGNGRAAVCIYQEYIPVRHQSHHSMFAHLDQNLFKYESLKSGRTSKVKPWQSFIRKENVLDFVDTNPRPIIGTIIVRIRKSLAVSNVF